MDLRIAIVPDIDAIETDVNNVSEARTKLDDLLNEIVDKNEDGTSTDEEGNKKRTHGILPTNTPSKKPFPGRPPRKKKKKDPLFEDLITSSKPSYVIKVFDRRVNLAKFNPDMSLYVMLREWMKNKPYSVSFSHGDDVVMTDAESTKISDSEGEQTSESLIYELPNPVKAEDASYPRPLPPALKEALVENIIDTKEDIEDLRKANMFRWRKVRNRWRDHSFRQQTRYLQSVLMLKSAMSTNQTATS